MLLLVAGLSALAGSAVVLALAAVPARETAGGNLVRSLQAFDRARAQAGTHRVEPGARSSAVPAWLRALGDRLEHLGRALTPGTGVQRLERQLDFAGNPANMTVDQVLRGKGIGLVSGLLTWLVIGTLLDGAQGALLGALGGAIAGFYACDLIVRNRAGARQQELARSLPDVLDTLVISVEAGLGFDAALAQVARHGKGPMVRELFRVLQEMQIGKSRTEALRAMAARTTVLELKGFVSAIIHSGELGVPIASVLREQASEMRTKSRQRAEEQAQKVPVKILFPVLFCIFPAMFVVVLGPGILSIMRSF
ncbi:type II secretion system F family protein [Catenuloplanes indicus]|uniref:Tight adherence protein C n=1 Tax=Catenuloplanes indicus TaxID=137267 RepID=A0AAE3W4V5_9ACTN|nr:type II secretion system F family protein [Catenuloplanes indicus]MDQ0368759.1 tight adherence protein C [Catenuloplanes indicus]